MTSFTSLLIAIRARLMAWQQQRLFDLWRDEWRTRRGY
jgi:hypothetical protein